MEEECIFCEEPEGLEKDVIKRYDDWTSFVNLKQKRLGRSIIKLERHVEDLLETTEEEINQLHNQVLPELKKALDKAFQPDLYNYASLGNSVRHLHIHVIPRYKDEREFMGKKFRDKDWNSHYKPYGENVEVEDEIRNAIAEELRKYV